MDFIDDKDTVDALFFCKPKKKEGKLDRVYLDTNSRMACTKTG